MIQPCPLYLHLISLVGAALPNWWWFIRENECIWSPLIGPLARRRREWREPSRPGAAPRPPARGAVSASRHFAASASRHSAASTSRDGKRDGTCTVLAADLICLRPGWTLGMLGFGGGQSFVFATVRSPPCSYPWLSPDPPRPSGPT